MDGGGCEVVFGFYETGYECLREGLQLGGRERDEGRGGERFAPEVGGAVGCGC